MKEKIKNLTWKQWVWIVVFLTAVILLATDTITVEQFFKMVGTAVVGYIMPGNVLFLIIVVYACTTRERVIEESARAQVKTKITQSYEKVVDHVDALPADSVRRILADDKELDSLWIRYSR